MKRKSDKYAAFFYLSRISWVINFFSGSPPLHFIGRPFGVPSANNLIETFSDKIINYPPKDVPEPSVPNYFYER